MKKILVAILAVAGFASYASAAIIGTGGCTLGGASFKPSTNVTVGVVASSTAYAATSKHFQGTKSYAAKSADQTIWYKDDSTGTSVTAPSDSTSTPSGYSSL